MSEETTVTDKENSLKVEDLPLNTDISGKAKKKGEWFFGTSGIVTLIGSLAIVLVLCFLDVLWPGKALIPNYTKYIIVCGLIYSIVSLGINFHSGYIGQTSLGHAAFYGTGAYVTAYLCIAFKMNFWITIPIGMLVAAIFSIPVAWAGRRVKGSFMVVITYAFSEVLRYIAINSDALGGTSGLSGIPTPRIMGIKITKFTFFSSNKDAYIIILYLLIVLISFFTWRVINSRTGFAFNAIREDEIAATAMGINVKAYKMKAVIISAVLCSLAGSFYAGFSNVVSPDLLSGTLSITIFTMLVVGGRRTIKGAILGAFLVVILPELLRYVQVITGLGFDPWYILYGVLLIVMMRFRPEGICGAKDN